MTARPTPAFGPCAAHAVAWVALALALGAGAARAQEATASGLTLTYGADILGNATGGRSRGVTYEGRLGLIADGDLHNVLGPGWRGHASVHFIHGRGLSATRLDNLLAVSGLEAEPALRVFNLWIERDLGRSSLRLGQFTAAQEFAVSPTGALFVNSTFGWPAAFAADLPDGGSSYPLAAPGVRLSVRTDARDTVLVAVFSGDPAGKGGGDPQRRDRSGFAGWRFADGVFAIAEAQRSFGPDGAGVVKAGGWRQSGGAAIDDWAAYAMADAPIWRDASGPRRLDGFLRVAATGERGLVRRYADAGVVLTGPLARRPRDKLGAALAWASVDGARAGGEGVAELTYQAVMSSRFSIQPDLQYVIRPSGSAPAGARAPNALVGGVRITASF